jgi:hypothetical protein
MPIARVEREIDGQSRRKKSRVGRAANSGRRCEQLPPRRQDVATWVCAKTAERRYGSEACTLAYLLQRVHQPNRADSRCNSVIDAPLGNFSERRKNF